MKKVYGKILIVCLIVLLSLVPCYANAGDLNGSGQITPMFSNIILFESTFDISNNGKATSTVYLDARTVNRVVVEAYLQQFKGGNWVTVKNWSNSREGTSSGLSQDWYVTSGYSYRLVTYGYVYQGSKLVESTSDTSRVIYY